MVIDNLYVDRAGRAVGPLKADPPLVIDADAVLALPIALQCFQPVARQGSEIFQARRCVQSFQPRLGLTCEAGKILHVLATGKTLGFSIPVADDHLNNLINNYALRQAYFFLDRAVRGYQTTVLSFLDIAAGSARRLMSSKTTKPFIMLNARCAKTLFHLRSYAVLRVMREFAAKESEVYCSLTRFGG